MKTKLSYLLLGLFMTGMPIEGISEATGLSLEDIGQI